MPSGMVVIRAPTGCEVRSKALTSCTTAILQAILAVTGHPSLHCRGNSLLYDQMIVDNHYQMLQSHAAVSNVASSMCEVTRRYNAKTFSCQCTPHTH